MKYIKTENKDESDRKNKEKNLYKQFFARILRYKKDLLKIIVMMFLYSLLYVSIPFVLKIGVQKLYLIEAIGWILIVAIGLIIAGMILGLIKEKLVINFALKFVNQIKKDLFKGVLKKSINKFKRVGTGKTLAYLSYNVSLIKSLVNEWGAMAAQQIINFIAIFIASFFVDIRLTILFFAILPIFVIYLLIIQWIVKNYALKLMTFNKQIFQSACSTLDDFENVKIMGLEEQKFKGFGRVLDKDMKVRIKRVLIYQYNKIILHGMSLLLIIAFIWIGGGYLHQQEMSFSEFVFFVLYIHLLFRPFEVTLYLSSFYEAGKIGIKTVFPYLSPNPFKKVDEVKLKGEIELRKVTYRHTRSTFKLHKISLKVEKGEKVTIHGKNNSGKSSFVQMLLNLRRQAKGKILFDDVSTKDLSPKAIRNNISVISRDYLLSNGTIYNFLVSGGSKFSKGFDEKIVNLCEELRLNEKIISIDSRKYLNKVYKNDSRFSESEKLKLALVRAAYKKSPILILDNFWHNFDVETKEQIEVFIKNHFKDKTIIQLTSKNDNSLIEADKEYKLQNGRLS